MGECPCGGTTGVALAAAGAKILSSVPVVGAFDVVSFTAAFGTLARMALLANWIPARRASRVDPIIAMKAE